jgi:oligoribonuclease NrnB/cAMP/cGMP phosphodiesterase (DHH superfamily)
MKIIVVYHSADYDGLFSGASALYWLSNDNPQMIGWDFGDPLVEVEKDVDLVYVIDLSPECLAKNFFDDNYKSRLIWIDHHASAIKQWDSDIDGLRINGVAACRLAWNYFYSTTPLLGNTKPTFGSFEDFKDRKVIESPFLTLVGEHDVWDHHDPDTMPLQYGLDVLETNWTLEKLTKFVSAQDYDKNTYRELKEIVEKGQAAMKWQENFAAKVSKSSGYITELEGIKFWTLVSPHARMSTWFPDNTIENGVEALMDLRLIGDGLARISLYHREGFHDHDLSVIASKYNGGGHKGACGFEIPLQLAIDLKLIK